MSQDPIGERGGVNLYGMVNNDPVGTWDQLGLSIKPAKVIKKSACSVVLAWGHNFSTQSFLEQFNELKNSDKKGFYKNAYASGLGCGIDGTNGVNGLGNNFPSCEGGSIGNSLHSHNGGFNPPDGNVRTGFSRLMYKAWI